MIDVVNVRNFVWLLVIWGLAGAAPAGVASAQTPPEKSTPTPRKPAAPLAPTPSLPPSASPGEPEASETAEAVPEPSLPLPRFVSLRTDPVNLRTGPGVRYPVDWVYVRRKLPVEIIAEFETWRQIRDADGAEGWVHQSMLSGRRTGMIRGRNQVLHKTNSDESVPLAILEPGVVVDIVRCPGQGAFCRVEVKGAQGWLKRDQVWGVYPDETVE